MVSFKHSQLGFTPLALTLSLALSASSIAAPVKYTSPADAGVINEPQIIYWLTKRGELSPDATELQKQQAVAEFTRKARANNLAVPLNQTKRINQVLANKKQQQNVAAVSTLADSDVEKAVNVLAVLVDFPDLPYNDNQLTPSDTAMYYSDYAVAHYEDILFSSSGFAGPNGENLQTAYQYFDQASGGTFSFNGEVKGWVTADNNAAYYGGNDANNNDNDVAVPELVMEAVTKAVAGMTSAELAQFDIEDPYDLNNNGNLDEADGMIDHIVIFHSSLGEEVGGGVLGTDAIWSHRFFVGASTFGSTIPGTSMKVYGYTVQPIDSASGVITHEFGHDLGLPDEYDTSYGGDGSPVGSWSLMAGGTWVGQAAGGTYIPGTKPSGFSPYARSYLQARYKGKWVNERTINWAEIGETGLSADLVSAVNAEEVNQLSIPLPVSNIAFKAPYAGEYQYYSGKGHMMTNTMTIDLDLPAQSPLMLSFYALWDIEVDYDYSQVLINNVAIAGNHTIANNPLYNNVNHYISGKSSDISSGSGSDAWVELTYDLSAYAGQSVELQINYITDQAVGGFGMLVDNISLTAEGSEIFSDDAETVSSVNVDGYARIDDTVPGLPQRYIAQLRNYLGLDEGLENIGYEPGVLLWLENSNYEDNNVSEHAGYSLIGVVDADQNLIMNGSSDVQVRDASFSLYPQTAYGSDNHLSNQSQFDDSNDFSAPLQPQSGMVLQQLGLSMDVTAQSTSSQTATVEFSRNIVVSDPDDPEITVDFDVVVTDFEAAFTASVQGGDGDYSYVWDFGEAGASSDLANPTHIYSSSNGFVVTLTVTDSTGISASYSRIVEVVIELSADFSIAIVGSNNMTVKMTNNTTGGFGTLDYSWDMGDGTTLTGENPANYTYTTEGEYQIILTVTDEKGNVEKSAWTFFLPAVVEDVPDNSGESSGGSLGWLSLFMLSLLMRKRQSRR
ncbi:peptidase M6 [Shewanella sp. UCD-FRSSP16_17]|uniref:immune inhibitor A domain-containing protein n=1 Tax=Shewanella sp. UCD-FRSSP16_17 TaxID=1853256 RepID=UPI0007EEB58C|nr:immune inhibitor A domain-containing protein [Shewanella sp. UCD-FRSSP16_17]OBT04225.1 peptidase M6 [Shewanella sp. UCD-FRSSP16_17]